MGVFAIMRRLISFPLFVLVFWLMICGSLLQATTLQLRDGTLIQGKYLGGTADSINLLVNGKIKTYPVSQVLLLEFNSNSTAASTSACQAAVSTRPAAATETTKAKAATATKFITVPAGTQIEVRMIDTVSSAINHVGDKFHASLEEPLEVNGVVLAPRGADAYGRLIQAQQAGRIEGQSELRLELTGVEINGRVVPVVTSDYQAAGASRGKQTATRAGIGAGLGALIGAIAGGGKGAAIGAAVGGGAGTATQIITHGQQVNIPSETVLDFTTAQPFTVTLSGAASQ
jgi:hypothetical protein